MKRKMRKEGRKEERKGEEKSLRMKSENAVDDDIKDFFLESSCPHSLKTEKGFICLMQESGREKEPPRLRRKKKIEGTARRQRRRRKNLENVCLSEPLCRGGASQMEEKHATPLCTQKGKRRNSRWMDTSKPTRKSRQTYLFCRVFRFYIKIYTSAF